MLPGFSGRDLVAVLINYNDDVDRWLVVCSDYLPYDSENPPLSKEFKAIVFYCEIENLRLDMGCDSNAHHTVWSSTNCNDRRVVLVNF